ncbi:MAG: PfkB family carbohydrate kinase [Fusobacteriaceae bacterium]
MTKRENEILKWIQENPLISQHELANKANITRSSVAVHISNLIKKGKILGKGYLISQEEYVTVIGGTNIDVAGIPTNNLIENDSNPGIVKFSIGGVGRNIAENISKLGVEVNFITALGNDMYGSEIQKNCKEKGIEISNSWVDSSLPTSTYLFVLNEKKDMQLAISDMAICDKITPEFIEKKIEFIKKSSLCVIDTNLLKETIEYVLDNLKIPVFVDCVSTTKAIKVKEYLNKIHTLKCNKIEAETLNNIKITNENSLKESANYFLNKGINQIFISLGEEGVFYANKEESGKINAMKTKVLNATGAGDSFMGAIAYSYLKKDNIKISAITGVAAATITVQSEKTVSDTLNVENIIKLMEEYK